jgi:septal ring factor EnvC (AmiA/AmiB activator)
LANINKLLSATHCEYTGVPFDDTNPMSVERIDNSLGYIPGNVIPVATMVNQIKSDNDFDKLLELKEHFENRHQARLKEYKFSALSVQRKIKGREDQIKALQKQITKLQTDLERLSQEIERMEHGEDDHARNADIVAKIIAHLKDNQNSTAKYMTWWQKFSYKLKALYLSFN